MLYSKLGSIPKPETDGTEGWIEVPEPPVAPEGKEVIWWYPPGWVVRDIKPADRNGFIWNWSQSEEKWIESELPISFGENLVDVLFPSSTESTSSTAPTGSEWSSFSSSPVVMVDSTLGGES
jgi:hypothetical protein